MRSFGFIVLFAISMLSKAEEVTVYAAASLTNAITDIARQYEAKHKDKEKMTISFAASSALAKQIEQGAPADIFVSADLKWMDYLISKGKIDQRSRRNVLGNTLVMVAPADTQMRQVEVDKVSNFPKTFDGKICTGDPEFVPVGLYAKEAIMNLGWWDMLKYKIVGTEDVRTALVLVERKECEIGIVYETDAKISDKVKVIGIFPESSHAPIVYPFALVTQSSDARFFFEYLTGQIGLAVFTKYGFKILNK